MKYMMLIYQGTTRRRRRRSGTGSRRTRRGVYGAYKGINETPGVTPGLQMQPAETATTVRVQDGKTADHRRPLRRDQGGGRRLLLLRGPTTSTLGDRAGLAGPAPAWAARSRSADGCVVATVERAFREQWGRRARFAHRLPRRLRPRRGSRAGGVRDRGGALAVDGAPGNPVPGC